MDAVRISDGELIALKHVVPEYNPFEVQIATMFSTEPLKSHPKNHCVPIFEVLDVPDKDNEFILVMPLLRRFQSPWFVTVGESVEFFRQIFEVCPPLHATLVGLTHSTPQGLQFIHQCDVTHRYLAILDLCFHGNIKDTDRKQGLLRSQCYDGSPSTVPRDVPCSC